jgi:hypothetical protein
VPATQPKKQPAADAVVRALTRAWPETAEPETARRLAAGFAWFSDTNRQTALQHVQGAVIAAEHQFSQQVALHLQQAQRMVLQDVADRLQAMVLDRFGYRGLRHFNPAPVSDAFTVVASAEQGVPTEWHYTRLHAYARLIPSQALMTLDYVEQAGLHAQAYWVADMRQPAKRVSLDPILSAQLGPFFVALAEWL